MPANGVANLVHVGRPKGALGKYKRALKHALILAAEKSRHSKDQSLESYCIFLADEKPELFVSLLGRIIPLQARVNVRDQGHVDDINANMPMEEMTRMFAERMGSAYVPSRFIEHQDPEDEEQ